MLLYGVAGLTVKSINSTPTVACFCLYSSSSRLVYPLCSEKMLVNALEQYFIIRGVM